MQREIIESCSLLDKDGHITTEGWARFPFWGYRRGDIKASPFRIKEWDYYMVFSHRGRFGISFTVSDLGYLGLGALCFFDFERAYYHQVDAMKILPMGTLGLPSASNTEGEIEYFSKNLSITYSYSPGKRTIKFDSSDTRDSEGNRAIAGTIILESPEAMESTVIATSWKENRRAFYCEAEIPASLLGGRITLGNVTTGRLSRRVFLHTIKIPYATNKPRSLLRGC